MPMQDRPRSPLLDVPEADGLIKAATGQGASIRAPGHAHHPVRMPRERLETASAFHIPQLDGAIKARAGELRAIGCEGQSPHPLGMPLEDGNAASRPGLVPLPQSNRALEIATDEPPPVWAPGQRADRSGMRHVLEGGAGPGIPEPDGRIQSPTGEQASIGGKSHPNDASGVPARPDQGATLYIPQLDAAIIPPAGQLPSIWAESQSKYVGAVSLPDPMESPA